VRSATTAPADHGKRKRRWWLSVVVVGLVLLTPVPWMLPRNSSFGMAWQLDGRLEVNGAVLDPPGEWTWVTAGRPPLVAEVLLRGQGRHRYLRTAPAASKPVFSEPLAAAVGLHQAGYDIEFRVMVQAAGARHPDLPDPVQIVELSGIALDNLAAWQEAKSLAPAQTEFRTVGGEYFVMPGPGLPYQRVSVSELAPPTVVAAVGGKLAAIPPFSLFRSLALGRSHGLVVALATYADAVDLDLARGRHIAATGGVRSDGSVTRIGGLHAKARAARRVGVDVFFFPAGQEGDLITFDPGSMNLVPVATLGEAIDFLADGA
jgi:hypothetical protein